jgi:hypothetical protein
MSDNKQSVGEPDRRRGSGSEGYEVDDFAKKHGHAAEQARELLAEHGDNREPLDAAAQQLKS